MGEPPGIQRRACVLAACSRAAGGTARDLPRMALCWRSERYARRHGISAPVVPDGPRPCRRVRAVWWEAVVTGRVLRVRCGGHRDHREERGEARADDARDRSAVMAL